MAGATVHIPKTYRNNANTRIAKYSVLVVGSLGAGYAGAPGVANAGAIVGVAMEDICENDVNAWAGGVQQFKTGDAPAAGSRSLQGRNITVAKSGIVRVNAAGAINVGDWVNIADVYGRVKTVNEAASTLVNILGMAETAAAAAGDVIQVSLQMHSRHQ